ncbi:hypothetical protein BPOR_0661g00020 [Botrytis porri]|uniref:Uncharacterized protein n=1 Tax=Botrytis porri TaxID=87229 RepID=A0A4Z1KPI9_9HELO|nr:hypothetical protein BPOR_0661g00020 [Botrytis porri]
MRTSTEKDYGGTSFPPYIAILINSSSTYQTRRTRFRGSNEIHDKTSAVSSIREGIFGLKNKIKTMMVLIPVQMQYKWSSDD